MFRHTTQILEVIFNIQGEVYKNISEIWNIKKKFLVSKMSKK